MSKLTVLVACQAEAPVPAEDEGPSGLPAEADREEREAYLQKRMVDFVKRRVLVLEKVLNAEYHCTVCFTVYIIHCLFNIFFMVLDDSIYALRVSCI